MYVNKTFVQVKVEIQDWAVRLAPVIVCVKFCYLSALARCCVSGFPQMESLPVKY
jgi:hypothetical protein